MAAETAQGHRFQRQAKIELRGDRVYRQAVKVLVPFRQPRVEHGGIGDLHGLPVVGRRHRRLVPEPDDNARTILAELLGQRHPRLETVEQPPIGQIQYHALGGAQHAGRLLRFGQPHFGPGRTGRGLAIGQIHNADPVALRGQLGQRAAAGDLHIVRVSTDRDHVQLRIALRSLALPSR